MRQLHWLVDLGFPEFTRHVKDLGRELACALLEKDPTAEAFRAARLRTVAYLRYDGRHFVGRELAQALLEAAGVSVGTHHAEAWRV